MSAPRKDRERSGREELEVPAVGTGEAVSGERLFQVALPFFEPARVVERLDPLAPVDVDEAELEGAGLHLTRFVTDVVVAALEPPEHGVLIGRVRVRLQAVRATARQSRRVAVREFAREKRGGAGGGNRTLTGREPH